MTVAKAAIKTVFLGLAALAFWNQRPALGQAPALPAPPRVHLLVPGCETALPLDEGHAFAGPRFLIWDHQVRLFEEAPPAGAGQAPHWRLASTENLPASPPAAGLGRARVKWRDGALWMKAGSRVYQRDATTLQWFLMADPGLDFRDFDVDLQGRILLIATADPRNGTYRALLEAVSPDRRSTEILFPYPDPDYRPWFDRISPVAAATLLTGYESVQLQEYLVLYNPLARRVFIYQALDHSLREARLGLAVRDWRALAARPGEEPAPPTDLCWQILPKSPSEAWIVYPAAAVPGGAGGLAAICLDLVEGRGEDPIDLSGRRLPLFPDASGHLAELADALETYRQDLPAPRPGPEGRPHWPESR